MLWRYCLVGYLLSRKQKGLFHSRPWSKRFENRKNVRVRLWHNKRNKPQQFFLQNPQFLKLSSHDADDTGQRWNVVGKNAKPWRKIDWLPSLGKIGPVIHRLAQNFFRLSKIILKLFSWLKMSSIAMGGYYKIWLVYSGFIYLIHV